jgi:hypothetical protein
MSDRSGVSLPARPNEIPGFPSNFRPLPFEGYTTLNTKSPRPVIESKELAWCDGWMPLSENNIRILPDVGPDIFTAVGGLTVIWHGFGNIAENYYGYVLLSDGSLQQFNAMTGATTQVLAPGAIAAPSTIFGQSQWGSKYQLFCKDQPNGYWVWDGTYAYTAGTIDPEVDITNAGTKYTTSPSISFQTTGLGTGAAATATVLNGSVTLVTITNPGSGFGATDFVIGTFSGGGSDNQATAVAVIGANSGGVTEIIIENPGSGYTPYATVSASGGGGGSGFVGYPVIQSGAIVSIAVVNPGTGYTVPPAIAVTDPGYGSGSSHVNGGTGCVPVAILSFGQITFISVTYGGSGYTTPPRVTIVGDGEGCVATAIIQGGNVVNFVITNYGSGYSVALVLLTGGNNAANADFNVFPWGVSGTTIETDQDRVWIGNGAAVADTPPKNRVIYSDPGTPTGFGNGGGAFQSDDSFLRVGYHWLKQTNGFLYLGGDSSTNYISGVSTSSTAATSTTPAGPPITTFSNLNVDPQIGSPWPASVQVLSRNIVLANPQGIFVSYGGAMTKISTPIDPLYASCPNLTGSANWSSAVANIFNVQVYMLLIQVYDQLAGGLIAKLILWDGKRFFTSQQSKSLTFIASQEVNSVLTAWGTDGTSIFRLFQNQSTLFTKRLQSKLYAGEGYFITKTWLRQLGVVQVNVLDEPLTIAIDNETQTGSPAMNVAMTSTGINVFGPLPFTQGQQGHLLGYTITTLASDLQLLSLFGEGQDFATNL